MKYQIGKFELDTERFVLLYKNQTVAIEPKVFDVIVYLIRNRQRMVSRDELFEHVWSAREVSDTTLSNHIKSARRALNDSGDLQHVIKTIRGRGYQFVAQVNTQGEVRDHGDSSTNIVVGDKPEPLETDIKYILNKRPLFSLRTTVLAAMLLLVLILSISLFYIEALPSKNDDARPYILVIPFEVSSSDTTKWRPFADQVTREITVKLRQISGLRVVPASSAFIFQHNQTKASISQKAPDVRYVLRGMINSDGQHGIRITSELEDIFEEKLIWNGEHTSQINESNFFSIQAEIATSVSGSLKVAVLDEEKRSIGQLPTANFIAYEYYVAGRQQADLLTHKSLLQAVALFNQAIDLDPQFESAHIAKADAYRIIMAYFDKPIDVLPLVVDSVANTLAINPHSAQAHSSMGLAYVLAWRWEDAWNMLNHAKQLDPDLVLTELGFALYYTGIGEVEGVLDSLQKANKLDPLNIELADWGHWALTMSGQIDKALKWAENKIRLHPEVGLLYSGASVAASLAGQHERAIQLAQKGVELDYGVGYSLLALAQTYGHANQLEKITPLITEAELQGGYLCPYESAIAYLLNHKMEAAFNHLNDAVSYRSNCLIFTRNDPRLAPIKGDPRFEALLTKIGLDDRAIKRYPR